MARTTQEPDDGSDSDAVSITSTVASEPKEVYIVERILAEEQAKDGAIYYLIDWEGYPIERFVPSLFLSSSLELQPMVGIQRHHKGVSFSGRLFSLCRDTRRPVANLCMHSH